MCSFHSVSSGQSIRILLFQPQPLRYKLCVQFDALRDSGIHVILHFRFLILCSIGYKQTIKRSIEQLCTLFAKCVCVCICLCEYPSTYSLNVVILCSCFHFIVVHVIDCYSMDHSVHESLLHLLRNKFRIYSWTDAK